MTASDMKRSNLGCERWERARRSRCMAQWSLLPIQCGRSKTTSMKWRWPSRMNLKKWMTCIAGINTIASAQWRTYRDLNSLPASGLWVRMPIGPFLSPFRMIVTKAIKERAFGVDNDPFVRILELYDVPCSVLFLDRYVIISPASQNF